MFGSQLSVDDLLVAAKAFDERLRALKASLEPANFWYPYGSAADNVYLMSETLTGERRNLGPILDSGRISDIGAADGELAFFLESLGCQATIVDFGATNFNGLRGARRLREALGSRAEIVDANVDDNPIFFGWYDLTFLLGTLYHFKNPFGALERLAKWSRYCMLSTRIARTAPDKVPPLAPYALTYLVEPGETNNDATNFWIFSEAGLRRLIARTGWSLLDYATFGNTNDSDPASTEGDERAFCLLRSELS